MKIQKAFSQNILSVGFFMVIVLCLGLFFNLPVLAKVVEFEHPIQFPLDTPVPSGDDLIEGVMYYNSTDKKVYV